MNKFNTELKLDIVNKMNLMVEEPDYFCLDIVKSEIFSNNTNRTKNEIFMTSSNIDANLRFINFKQKSLSDLKKFLPFFKKQSYFNDYQSITNKIIDTVNNNKILINPNNDFNKETIDNLFSLNNNVVKVEMGNRNTDLFVAVDLVYNINLKTLYFRIDYQIFHAENDCIILPYINSDNYEFKKTKEIIDNFYKEKFFKPIIDKTVDELSEEEKTLIKMSYY